MEEVGQDFVYYTDPMDPEAIADSIVQCVEAPDKSSRREQAIEHARTFSWALTAAKTIQVYQEIARP